jgi:hypothetical protein
MKIIAINKHSCKLKICSVEMPNAPYSNRCVLLTQFVGTHEKVFITLCKKFFEILNLPKISDAETGF